MGGSLLPAPGLWVAFAWALCLTLCLLQLDQICISFDNGRTVMNFVEAALVIQGSVSIYSKKVRAPWWPPCQPCWPSAGHGGAQQGLDTARSARGEGVGGSASWLAGWLG